MPLSSYAVAPEVAYLLSVRKLQIKSVLDVGCGFGFYGMLVRNYLDEGKEPFQIYMDAVEAFPKYRNLFWANYHHIFEQPVENVEFKQKYDAIIMCDVIEHFEKEQGLKVIEKLKNQLTENGILIISTPSIFCEQGAVNGNIYETHKSLWDVKEFKELGFKIQKDGKKDKWEHYMICAFYENSKK